MKLEIIGAVFGIGIISFLVMDCRQQREKDSRPEKRMHKDLCVARCVESLLYGKEEIGTGVIDEASRVCGMKFQHLECCESRHVPDYYVECNDR